MTSDNSGVAHNLSQRLAGLEDGIHFFSIKTGTPLPLNEPNRNAPLLTGSGETKHIDRLVDCFKSWDGEVTVAALQDEGLLDVWVF